MQSIHLEFELLIFNKLGLLRRLHTFSLSSVNASDSGKTIENDPLIRQLAIVSQLAVFKDIIPGYRIRSLTDAEKAEKVSQVVARTREWEQGLVSVYQTYLRGLETEVKSIWVSVIIHVLLTQSFGREN